MIQMLLVLLHGGDYAKESGKRLVNSASAVQTHSAAQLMESFNLFILSPLILHSKCYFQCCCCLLRAALSSMNFINNL